MFTSGLHNTDDAGSRFPSTIKKPAVTADAENNGAGGINEGTAGEPMRY
jgi:hypothetical protein